MTERLGLFQRVYRAFVSEERFRLVVAETRRWRATCKHCARDYTAWDVGGVFLRNPNDNGGVVKCPHCGRFTRAFFRRKQD